MGGILCVGDLPADVTWDQLVEKGGGGGGDGDDDGGIASATFRVMPPDLIAPNLRDINGKGDYDRDAAYQVIEPEGIAVNDPAAMAGGARARGGGAHRMPF